MVEVPFYAQRLFAAGQEYFGTYFASDSNERFAFARLQQQRVPFVLIPSDELGVFDNAFSLVAPYVHAHYVALTDIPVNDDQTIHILVNRDLPVAGTDAEQTERARCKTPNRPYQAGERTALRRSVRRLMASMQAVGRAARMATRRSVIGSVPIPRFVPRGGIDQAG